MTHFREVALQAAGEKGNATEEKKEKLVAERKGKLVVEKKEKQKEESERVVDNRFIYIIYI